MKKRKREPVPKIRTFDDPVLKEVCSPVEEGENVDKIMRGMASAINRTKTGVGLAAPQIGEARRIILVSQNGFHKLMINPVIEWKSSDTRIVTEGCLSYPGRSMPIRRAFAVRVSYINANYGPVENEYFSDMGARIVQHEIDHLNGICKLGV